MSEGPTTWPEEIQGNTRLTESERDRIGKRAAFCGVVALLLIGAGILAGSAG